MHYPSVLADNENIYFKLRCRKFIEMIRRCTELQAPSTRVISQRRSNSSFVKAASNAHNGTVDEHDVFDEDVELVDAPADEVAVDGECDEMDMEDSDLYSQQNNLMGETLRYGQELQSEFKDDPRREVKQALEDTFALIAYPNAKESSLAPLLETDGRLPVAEELNSAILGGSNPRSINVQQSLTSANVYLSHAVSLGKSSNAVLERLCQQSEVLVGDLAHSGYDGAALLNIKHDYLRA